MKFLVDAQLPQRLARWLTEEGHDVVHTKDLPQGNRTEDREINELSLREQRTVVTKDSDFVDSILLQQAPYRLLLISTGNIGNPELLTLLGENLETIVSALETSNFVELDQSSLIVHE